MIDIQDEAIESMPPFQSGKALTLAPDFYADRQIKSAKIRRKEKLAKESSGNNADQKLTIAQLSSERVKSRMQSMSEEKAESSLKLSRKGTKTSIDSMLNGVEDVVSVDYDSDGDDMSPRVFRRPSLFTQRTSRRLMSLHSIRSGSSVIPELSDNNKLEKSKEIADTHAKEQKQKAFKSNSSKKQQFWELGVLGPRDYFGEVNYYSFLLLLFKKKKRN